jgi:hypothetical protein
MEWASTESHQNITELALVDDTTGVLLLQSLVITFASESRIDVDVTWTY